MQILIVNPIGKKKKSKIFYDNFYCSVFVCFFFVTQLTGLHGVTVYSSTKIRGQTPGTTHLSVTCWIYLAGPWNPSNQTAMRQLGFSGAAYCGSLNSTQSATLTQQQQHQQQHKQLCRATFASTKSVLHRFLQPSMTQMKSNIKNCCRAFVWAWRASY